MTRRCYLVSCVSAKQAVPAKAKDLYVSPLFRKARLYVERSAGLWFILSAEHGLVDPETVIEPYEKTLNGMGVRERQEWATKVIGQMEKRLPACEEIVAFAGVNYRDFLMEYLASRTPRVVTPLKGLRIGEQMSWLSSHLPGELES